jgi:hypothetical protein
MAIVASHSMGEPGEVEASPLRDWVNADMAFSIIDSGSENAAFRARESRARPETFEIRDKLSMRYFD